MYVAVAVNDDVGRQLQRAEAVADIACGIKQDRMRDSLALSKLLDLAANVAGVNVRGVFTAVSVFGVPGMFVLIPAAFGVCQRRAIETDAENDKPVGVSTLNGREV